MKLPTDIVNDFKQRRQLEAPEFAVRGLSDVEGNIGETFILGANGSLLIYSGKLGEKYQFFEFNFKNIQHFALEVERPFAYLDFKVENQEFRLKFAAFDIKTLKEIEGRWLEARKHVEKPSARTPSSAKASHESEIPPSETSAFSQKSPFLGFCAVLQALVNTDSSVAEKEKKKLNFIVNDQQLLANGLAYWEEIGIDKLMAELVVILSPEQKRCLVANLLEIAMVDGILHEEEKTFIENTRKRLDVNVKEFNAIFDVLMVKNNLSIF